jgi:hypothetical protein
MNPSPPIFDFRFAILDYKNPNLEFTRKNIFSCLWFANPKSAQPEADPPLAEIHQNPKLVTPTCPSLAVAGVLAATDILARRFVC